MQNLFLFLNLVVKNFIDFLMILKNSPYTLFFFFKLKICQKPYITILLTSLVSQLKLVPVISLRKKWQLVMSLTKSRDWCALYKPETNFW